ncbi:MAG: Hsp20/alpha crystallin family protein [Pirellulales bacterium]
MATDLKNDLEQAGGAERTRLGRYFRPPVDIMEKADELLLVADLPGATSESIDIHFEDGVLSIEGKVEPRYDDKMNFALVEYGVGSFHRTFRVSEQIDSNRIHADYADGVLTVHLPKAEAARPRKIQVQTQN